MSRRMLVVGNWKMNGMLAQLGDVEAIGAVAAAHPAVEVGLCLPATLISAAAGKAGAAFIGAQDCHAKQSGAHTGCLSAAMLKEAGAAQVIVGHSERRTDQHETSADVAAKALAAQGEGLGVILCLGESLETRDAGDALSFVLNQLSESLPQGASADWLSIAYEPIWAIGTGKTATPEIAQEACSFVRALVADKAPEAAEVVRVLYGGSVKGSNAAELLGQADIDGALVGGASLDPAGFSEIIDAVK